MTDELGEQAELHLRALKPRALRTDWLLQTGLNARPFKGTELEKSVATKRLGCEAFDSCFKIKIMNLVREDLLVREYLHISKGKLEQDMKFDLGEKPLR